MINDRDKKVLDALRKDKSKEEIQRITKEGKYSECDKEFKDLFKGIDGFIARGGCLYQVKKKDEQVEYRYLANFVPFPTGEIIKDDGAEQVKYFSIEGKHCKGQKFPAALVSAQEFTNMNWITKQWGMKANIATGATVKDNIRNAIQCLYKEEKQEYIYMHTGWRKINNEWVYLYYGGAVGTDQIHVDLPENMKRYQLFPLNDDEKMREAFKQLLSLAENRIMYPLLSMVFLSPITSFLKMEGIDPKFILFLQGRSGTFKSTLAALMLSFFGDFNDTSLPLRCSDTGNSIVEQTFILKDTLTAMDDFFPSTEADKRRMNSTVQSVLRAYGDRTGRNKLRSDSSVRVARPPRGNMILTGEYMPDVGFSGISRLFNINLNRGDIERDILTKLQKAAREHILSGIMYEYILYLKEKRLPDTEFTKTLRDSFEKYRLAFQQELTNSETHLRNVDQGAILMVGLEMMLEFLQYKEILKNPLEENLKRSKDVILNGIMNQGEDLAAEKPAVKYCEALNAMIGSNEVSVINLEDPAQMSYSGSMKNLIGYYDNKFYYIDDNASFKCVCQFYSAQGSSFPVNLTSLKKALKEEGLLKCGEKSMTLQKNIKGNNKRRLWIYKEQFDNLG